jgi:hypothetical protein
LLSFLGEALDGAMEEGRKEQRKGARKEQRKG